MKAPHKNWKAENRVALEESQKLLEKYGIKVATDPRNRVMAENRGHTIEYTKRVWERLKLAEQQAIKDGKTIKEIEVVITRTLKKIGEVINKRGLGGLT